MVGSANQITKNWYTSYSCTQPVLNLLEAIREQFEVTKDLNFSMGLKYLKGWVENFITCVFVVKWLKGTLGNLV